MTAIARLAHEDKIGLSVAVAAHVILAIGLIAQVRFSDPPLIAPPERINVSLANDVSLQSTAPDPSENPAAAFAPEIAEVPEPEAVEAPAATEQAVRPATTQPRRDTPRASERAPTPRATTRPTPAPTPSAAPSPRRATGTRLGGFEQGLGDADGESGSPAAVAGPAQEAALVSAISRQIKEHWSAPRGVDAERLVTILSWELNPDGSLKGRPRFVDQLGRNASNQAQAELHVERAIRAVQLAAPFDLPPQYYDSWRRIRQFRFDRRL